MKHNRHLLTGGILLVCTLALCFASGRTFMRMHGDDTIYAGPGLTEKTHLSRYLPALKNSPGDTAVYIFKGKNKGGSLLVLGGTHPNEPAGCVTAVVMEENIRVKAGKVIIIPQANLSGFTHTDPQEGNPQRFGIQTASGTRRFRFGSRLTNPIHQWPDPILDINPAGQKLAGAESRNLNRSYPGKKNGNLTEKVAYAIMQLLKQEQIDLAIDLHEAAPEYPVINAIVFHENSAELAATALMELQLEDFEFRLEASPKTLHGLSHREWGDHTHTKAVLLETANASHGRLRGRSSPELIVQGRDKNYVKAAKLGLLFVPWGEKGVPLKVRVGRHLAAVQALISALNDLEPDKRIGLLGIPSAAAVKGKGIGTFLIPPKQP